MRNEPTVGNGNLGVHWKNALADYTVFVKPGVPLDPAQDQHAQLFVTLFNALLGFWRTPIDRVLKERTDVVTPRYPKLRLAVIPVGIQLTVSVIAAVLDDMLAQLAESDPPKLEVRNVITKAYPSRTIGIVVTQLRVFPEPRALLSGFSGGSGTGHNITGSNNLIDASIRFKKQAQGFPVIKSGLWLDQYRVATSSFMREYDADGWLEFDPEWPADKPFFETQKALVGGTLVTQFWLSIPQNDRFLFGDFMYGMSLILEKVVAARTFETMEGLIKKNNIQVLRYLLFWRPEQQTVPVS